MKSKKYDFIGIFALMSITFFNFTGYCYAKEALSSGIPVVINRKAVAAIIVSDDCPENIKNIADFLRYYIKKSSSANIPTYSNNKHLEGKTAIYIGKNKYTKHLDFSKFKSDGFYIFSPNNRTICIVGKDEASTDLAVFDFLDRYIGVKWLLPGKAWEIVPKHENIMIPRKMIRQEAAFYSRCLSLGYALYKNNRLKVRKEALDIVQSNKKIGNKLLAFCYRNKLVDKVLFHHNLDKLFPPEIYISKMPELFPVINGKRHFPKSSDAYGVEVGWQPCMTNEAVIKEAVKNICVYLKKHPSQKTFSLGVNDGGGYCTCANCRKYTKTINGKRNYSDLYFQWANKIVEGVLKQYPDVFFGTLGYGALETAPSVKLHPHLIVYVTNDIMSWADKSRRENKQKMIREWEKKDAILGWYDYVYGKDYLIPRVYFHLMADGYKYLYEHNVRNYYAESYPPANAMEGPKLYILIQLLYNPYLNVNKALTQWYTLAVGEKAAPYLAKYYKHLEDFWVKRATKTTWFNKGNTFLHFLDSGYMEAFKQADVDYLRKQMIQVQKLADTPAQKKRAKLLFNTFKIVEKNFHEFQSILINDSLITAKKRIFNDSFNVSGKGWTYWERVQGSTFTWNKNGHLDKGSLQLDYNSVSGNACFYKNFKLIKGIRGYEVKMFVKGKNISDKIYVQLNWKRNGQWLKGEKFARRISVPGRDCEKWKEMKLKISVPDVSPLPDVLTILIGTTSHKSGTIFVDDVVVNSLVMKSEKRK